MGKVGLKQAHHANAAQGRASVLLGYSFGKAQRILAGVDASIGPILVHGAVEPLNAAYRAAGVRCRRVGVELFIHHADEEAAKAVDAKAEA